MKGFVAEFMPRWQSFLDSYGWYIVAFLVGALVVMGVWMVKHPEDFWTVEDEDQTREER